MLSRSKALFVVLVVLIQSKGIRHWRAGNAGMTVQSCCSSEARSAERGHYRTRSIFGWYLSLGHGLMPSLARTRSTPFTVDIYLTVL